MNIIMCSYYVFVVYRSAVTSLQAMLYGPRIDMVH